MTVVSRSILISRFLFPLGVILFAAGKCLNISACHIDTDPAAFSAIGLHLLKGKTLYRDVWDSKPPGIFLLHQWAFWLFGAKLSSLKILALLFAGINGLSAYLLFLRIGKNMLTALLFSLVYLSLFYDFFHYNSGNFTEEYALIFLLSGFAIFYRNHTSEKVRNYPYVAAGLLAGCCFWFKEPFILSAAVIALYQLLLMIMQKRYRQLLLLFAGYLLPSLLMLLYLLQQGIVSDFISYLQYNMAYSQYESDGMDLVQKISKSIKSLRAEEYPGAGILRTLALCGLLSCCWPAFRRRHHLLPLLAACWFLADLCGASLSGYGYAHYYLQLIFSYSLLAILGFIALLDVVLLLLKRVHAPVPERYTPGAVVLLTAIIVMCSNTGIHKAVGRISFRFENQCTQDTILQYLQRHAANTDRLFVESSDACRYYIQSGLIADVKYPDPSFFFFKIKTDTYDGEKQALHMRKQLEQKPPRFVIAGKYFHEFSWISGATDFFKQQYHIVDSADDKSAGTQYLWQRN